jgi:hypothetical protein
MTVPAELAAIIAIYDSKVGEPSPHAGKRWLHPINADEPMSRV